MTLPYVDVNKVLQEDVVIISLSDVTNVENKRLLALLRLRIQIVARCNVTI